MKVFLKILLNICIVILAFLLGKISNNDIFNKFSSKLINKPSDNITNINDNNSGAIIELDVIENNNKHKINNESLPDSEQHVKESSNNLDNNMERDSNEINKEIQDIFFNDNSDITNNDVETNNIINDYIDNRDINNVLDNNAYIDVIDETSQNLEHAKEVNNTKNNVVNSIDIVKDIDNINEATDYNIEDYNINNTENTVNDDLEYTDDKQKNIKDATITDTTVDNKIKDTNINSQNIENTDNKVKSKPSTLDEVIANSVSNV